MNNPLELLKAIKNPKEYVMNYIKNNNNPIINNLVKEAENGNEKAIKDFANNMLKEKGMNIDEIMNTLK